MVVSKCPCFITKDTEFITAYQIRNDMKRHDSLDDYEDYIKILEKNGISNARTEMENMYILDFLIMNEDRHLNNFGIIRDVNTLKWLGCAPIFDNGQSLDLDYYNEDDASIKAEGRLFYEVKSFDEMTNLSKTLISRFGHSLDEQEDRLQKLCEFKGYNVFKVYEDAGISAKTGNLRPEFERLLQDIRDKKANTIVVLKLDRLTRSVYDMEGIMNFLEEKIISDGVIKEGNILKVDNFLNHQIDIDIMRQIAYEFKRRFRGRTVTKILTIEASGIAIATLSALDPSVMLFMFEEISDVATVCCSAAVAI